MIFSSLVIGRTIVWSTVLGASPEAKILQNFDSGSGEIHMVVALLLVVFIARGFDNSPQGFLLLSCLCFGLQYL
ncbi:hypothetical protein TIFTF001_003941 [Ficus carica]|uniref:Uncharacterized protein n=1 Tax=Ficus carica TaxID=3494 RepID=A0AA87ZVZ9_FICCA|nr:hypothetical protein TIFTF001_003941 [Ficus carica]